MAPFLWMVFNCLKVTATLSRQFTFYHSVPRNSWYSFYRPRKDERLIRSWSHPVVLNTGPIFSCFLTLTSFCKSSNHFHPYDLQIDSMCFPKTVSILQPQADHHLIFLLPDLIPYKTAFDYFEIVCFVNSYLTVLDTF